MNPVSPIWQSILVFSTCAALLFWLTVPGPPDFSDIPAGEARKAAFFAYLGPIVDRANERRLEDRAYLLTLQQQQMQQATLAKRDRIRLETLRTDYGLGRDLEVDALIEALLERVDSIPRSLALAQAAKESAWGTSRFAVEANNYFGQRCYRKNCGLVPAARRRGAKFEVRRFPSVEASVASYMNNINTHPEYQILREYRAEQRRRGVPLSGIHAAERLTQYSERRQAYVDEIQSLIHFNELESDTPTGE